MKADGTFTVGGFTPTAVTPSPVVTTALPVMIATMTKAFDGDICGHSATLFTAAFDQSAGIGTYVAMECFEGSIQGKNGAFNFVHSATTSGNDRTNDFFLIVPHSGTEELEGITGVGGLIIDADGTHRMWLEYELAD